MLITPGAFIELTVMKQKPLGKGTCVVWISSNNRRCYNIGSDAFQIRRQCAVNTGRLTSAKGKDCEEGEAISTMPH